MNVWDWQFPKPQFPLKKQRLSVDEVMASVGHLDHFKLQVQAQQLEAMDGFALTSDPFLRILKGGEVVYTSQVYPSSLNCTFEPILFTRAMNITPETELTMEIWDFDTASDHDMIGSLTFRVMDTFSPLSAILFNSNKQHLTGYLHSGLLRLQTDYQFLPQPLSQPLLQRL